MKKEQKMIYRITAQTDTVIITAQTSKAVTEEEARKDIPLVTGGNLVDKYVLYFLLLHKSHGIVDILTSVLVVGLDRNTLKTVTLGLNVMSVTLK